jgi:hypothetical protein
VSEIKRLRPPHQVPTSKILVPSLEGGRVLDQLPAPVLASPPFGQYGGRRGQGASEVMALQNLVRAPAEASVSLWRCGEGKPRWHDGKTYVLEALEQYRYRRPRHLFRIVLPGGGAGGLDRSAPFAMEHDLSIHSRRMTLAHVFLRDARRGECLFGSLIFPTKHELASSKLRAIIKSH